MAALAIAFVIVGEAIDQAQIAADFDLGGPEAQLLPTLYAIETGLTVVFAAEFGSRFLASYNRRAYLRGHWIDLIALIPVVRAVRVLRLLRLLRLVRAFAGIYRATQHFERMARHRGLAWLS